MNEIYGITDPNDPALTRIVSHKTWITNEYTQWIAALNSCTVHNFKENAMVQRMLGEVDENLYCDLLPEGLDYKLLFKLDSIGRVNPKLSGSHLRFIYYALKIIEQKPKAICEIGGGVGQLFATLRALGYTGQYYIYDLPEVKQFQAKYLQEVQRVIGIGTKPCKPDTKFDYCVSCYALGEFDDETKNKYIKDVVSKCPHGLVIWNPHSGASEAIPFKCTVTDEYPLTSIGNKLLIW